MDFIFQITEWILCISAKRKICAFFIGLVNSFLIHEINLKLSDMCILIIYTDSFNLNSFYFPNNSNTCCTTFSGVNPNSLSKTSKGAEYPK